MFLVLVAFTSFETSGAETHGRAMRPAETVLPEDMVQPVVLTPANMTITNNPRPPVTGTAGPNLPVQIWLDGAIVVTVPSDALGNWSWSLLSDLAQGQHEVGALVDYGGGMIAGSNLNVFLVDRTPPETSIPAGPPAITNSTSATFELEAVDTMTPFATFECRLDAGAFVACASPFTVNGIAEGAHTLAVRSIDMAGNVDASPATRTWSVDLTPPVTTLTSTPPSISGPAASFSFTGSDPQSAGLASGVASFVCGVDAFTLPSCSSPFSFSFPDGSHTFTVSAVDAAGNVDPTPAAYTWTVDGTPPPLPEIVTPQNGGFVTTTLPVISGTAEPSSTVMIRIDGAILGSVPADAAGAWSFATTVPLTQGMHTAGARATDSVGNTGWGSAEVTFFLDSIVPDTVIDSAPPALATSTTADFTFSMTEFAPPQFECSLDGASFATCSSPRTLVSLSDGPHTFAVRAVDLVGNVDPSPATHTWTIDSMPPETTITASPAAVANSASATFAFTGFDAGTGVSSFECTVDGAVSTCSSPLLLTGLTEGVHSFSVRASDNLGQWDATPATYVWVVDTTAPPAPVVTAPVTGAVTSNPQPPVAGTAEPGATVTVRVDGSAAGIATADGAGNFSFSIPVPLADGLHSVFATASDAALNTSPASNAVTFTVDGTAPETVLTVQPPVLTNATTVVVAFAWNDGSGSGLSSFSCTLDGGVAYACVSPHTLGGLTDGTHTLTIRAIDRAGNIDPTPATATWTVDVTPPETTIDSAPTALWGSMTSTFAFSGVDANGPLTFECSTDAGPFVTCHSPTLPFLPDGPHTFAVRAIDAAGNVDASPATHSWTIDATPPAPPVVTSPVNGSSVNTASVVVTGTAEPGTMINLWYTGGGLPPFENPTGNWSVVLNGLDAGLQTITVAATDPVGNMSLNGTSTFTVDRSTATAIASTGTPATFGTAVTFTATVTPTVSAPASPTGTVVFTIDGVAQAPVPLAGSTASLTTSSLALGPHSVVATYAGDSNFHASASPALTQSVVVGPPSPQTSTIVAAPSAVPANGTDVATITVALRDAFGNPVAGHAVSVAAVSGTATVAPVSATTNASGVATFSASSTVPGATAFGATDTTAGVTLAGQASVTFTPLAALASLAPAEACSNAHPVSLVMTGSSFASSMQVRWNGSVLPTTYVNATTLTAIVPAAQLPAAGSVPVDVMLGGIVIGPALAFTVTGDPDGPSLGIPASIDVTETMKSGGIRGTTPAESPTLMDILTGKTATDECSGVTSYSAVVNGVPVAVNTFFAVGETLVTVTGSDAAGNTTVQTVTVAVRKLDADDLAAATPPSVPALLQYIVGNIDTLALPPAQRRRTVTPPMLSGTAIPVVVEPPAGGAVDAFVVRITFDPAKVAFVGFRDAAGSPFSGSVATTGAAKANETGLALVAGTRTSASAAGRVDVGDVIVRELLAGGAASVSIVVDSVASR